MKAEKGIAQKGGADPQERFSPASQIAPVPRRDPAGITGEENE
jgi:hypothetical protein